MREQGLLHYKKHFLWYAKKTVYSFIYLVSSVLLLPVYLCIRILRPVKLIRFGRLESTRYGHLAGNTEMYMCQRDLGIQPRNTIDIFHYPEPVANRQLLRMWKRKLHVYQIANCFSILNRIFPGGDIHQIQGTQIGRDFDGIVGKCDVHLSFTEKEISDAEKESEKMGIRPDSPFVCLSVRDSAYLDKQFLHKSWAYHQYRDCDINAYKHAVLEIAERGYHVIRMGAAVKAPINIKHLRVIDYACNGYRTELLDIYLSAKCQFFISGGGSGVDSVPYIFRRPILYVDYDLLGYANATNPQSILTIKRMWLKHEHRFMTFREMLDSGMSSYGDSRMYDKHGIEHIESEPEEIRDVVIEMIGRLAGTWEANDEDEKLQKQFKDIFRRCNDQMVFNSRIGTHFLRQNRHLLKD